jgi:predicted phage terminase large subunit-like protein
MDEDLARAVAKISPDDFVRRWASLTDPADQLGALRLRFRYRIDEFARFCWPELFSLPWNAFHRHVLAAPDQPWPERVGRTVQRAIAAPRGVAKTTTAKARLMHALVYDIDRCIVVLSASQALSLAISGHLRAMLADEESVLSVLYGPFRVEGGTEEWRAVFPDGRLVGVFARSFGTQVRGTNMRGLRPTRILIDDGERPDRVRSSEQRTIWHRFLTDDVQKAGPKEGGLVIEWLGTVLHPDAILARLLVNPAWDGRKWRALIRWPERSDLWTTCREIWADLTLGDLNLRRACALAYYEANRAEMDEGAEVLDPVAEPLFRLFEYIWSDGLASFLREKQNEPRDPSAALFDSGRFARCSVVQTARGLAIRGAHGKTVLLADCRLYGRWDPSMGLPDGDYASLVVLARDRDHYGYLLEARMLRLKPSLQLVAFWGLVDRWYEHGLRRFSLESNGFQAMIAEEFRRQRELRRAAGKPWQVQLDEDPSTTSKEVRIAALEPSVANGWLQFSGDIPDVMFQQFDDFPSGDHDDGPDSVEGAWARSGTAPPTMAQERIR